jgi:hypothetical protein
VIEVTTGATSAPGLALLLMMEKRDAVLSIAMVVLVATLRGWRA